MFEKRGYNDILYVGGDDSNHAGNSLGEIIVATFSLLCKDGLVRDFPNVRDYSFLPDWINSEMRDYRFGILTEEKYRHSHSNLTRTIPSLITSFLDEMDFGVRILKIYLDGRLDKNGRNFLRDRFYGFRGIESVIVDNFIKKQKNNRGRISKHPHCPPVVYYADLLAHQLFSNETFRELSTHPKLVLIR